MWRRIIMRKLFLFLILVFPFYVNGQDINDLKTSAIRDTLYLGEQFVPLITKMWKLNGLSKPVLILIVDTLKHSINKEGTKPKKYYEYINNKN